MYPHLLPYYPYLPPFSSLCNAMIFKVPTIIVRLAVYLVFCQCFAVAANDHEVLATTNQGVVRGVSVHKDVNAYLGIPFAQPPIGSLRFMPPQPLTNTSLSESRKHTIYNATQFGPVCYQFHYRTVMGDALSETSGQSEDCLTLNIFVPKRSHSACAPTKKPMPVFVWSFGGAFGEGGGSMPMFNPTNFVAENKDIIVVTWKYDRFAISHFCSNQLMKFPQLPHNPFRVP